MISQLAGFELIGTKIINGISTINSYSKSASIFHFIPLNGMTY